MNQSNQSIPSGPTNSATSQGQPNTQLGETSIDHNAWKRLGYRWAWAGYPKVANGASIAEMNVYEDRIVTRDTATVISVMLSSSGRTVWGTEIDRPETKVLGIVRDEDRLLVTTETQLHEIELNTGNLIERISFEKLVNTQPVLNGNLAIFGTLDGELLAINRDFLLTEWRYGVGDSIASDPVLMDPYTVSVVTQAGKVATIDLSGPSARLIENINGGLVNNPVSDQYYLVIASKDRSVYGFREGKRIWRYRTSEPLEVQPVIHRDRVYFASPKLGVVCLDAATGEKIWSQPGLPNGWILGTNNGNLLAWTGVVLATIDAENGDVIASAEFPGISGFRTDKFEDGNLFAIAGRSTVLRFDPR